MNGPDKAVSRNAEEAALPQGLGRLEVTPKLGGEPFKSGDNKLRFALHDFWSWSASDLVDNTQRGVLAEFIVAKALGIRTEEKVREGWAAFDLTTDEGVKVEVKSAAYLQSWEQTRLSRISFETPKTRAWNPDASTQRSESKRHTDVYVFALLAHKTKPTVNPMNVNQWHFYAVPTAVLNERTRSQHSITLTTLQKLSGGPVDYFHLRERVSKLARTTKNHFGAPT